MHLAWKKDIQRKTLVFLTLVVAGAGVAAGFSAGLVTQAVVVEVHYPAAVDAIPWKCSIQLNNDPTFQNFAGFGTHTWTYYYVHNILATCSKADSSIYSIAVAFRRGTGQFLGESSGYPTATIHWVRPSDICAVSVATECPVPT